MRAALAVPGAMSTALAPGDVGTVGEARAFDQTRRGLHRFEGGYAGLCALLLERLETFSGERREKVVPVEVVMKRGRAAGIRVRPRDETIGCQHLIWAGPAPAMLAICPEKPARKGREAGDGLRVTGYRYAVSMLVTPEAIPEGMGSRVSSHRRSGAADARGQRHRRHRRPAGAARSGARPDLGRVPGARARGRRRTGLPAHHARARAQATRRACCRS